MAHQTSNSASNVVPVAPDSPTNLNLNSNHTLTWDVVLGAAKYKVESAEVGGVYEEISEETTTTHSLTDDDVTFKTRNYRVKACNEDNLCSIPSNGILVDYKLSLDAEDSAVILNWGPVHNASRYDVYYASQSLASVLNSLASDYGDIPGAIKVLNRSTLTYQEVSSLNNGTEYYFMVTATTTDSTVLVSTEESIRSRGFVDFSSAYNNYSGIFNASTTVNLLAFASLTADGTIVAWGDNAYGGDQTDVPAGDSFVKIYTTEKAFAAVTSEGSITAWGRSTIGSDGQPSGDDYVNIYSNRNAFVGLKADGSIHPWGG